MRSVAKRSRWTQFTFTAAVGALFAGLLALVQVWRVYHQEFPEVSVLKNRFPHVIYRGPNQSEQVQLLKDPPIGWTRLSEISTAAIGAVVVSEDWAFYQHRGYDAAQIKEALVDDLEGGKLRGASTITQQVVKNVFLTKDKTLWRKLKELLLATRLEKALTKTRILEVYLNIAEWGEGVYGIRAAAQRYFGKSPSQLTPKEGAFLAMLLPSPKRYSQSFKSRQLTDYARKSVSSILEKMTQARYITEEQKLVESYEPLSFESAPAPSAL